MKRILLTIALLIGVAHFQFSIFNFQFSMGEAFAQTNTLSIGNVNFPAGKTAILPIELTNQSDICGVQFEIGLPYKLENVTDAETGVSKLPFYLNQSRASGCDLSVRALSSGTTYMYYNGGTSVYKYVYRVIITSADNTPIKGSSGTLLTIEMPLPETLENGAQLWSMFRDNKIILSDRAGNQVASSNIGSYGIISVEVIPRPDLVPSNIAVAQALASPGDQLDFTWKVENIGDTATSAGWTEKLFLENENKTRVYVGTTSYDGTLNNGASVERSFSVNLDEYPGISGNCRPVVQILPVAGSGEIPLNQGNNTATGKNYSLFVKKYLILTPYKNVIPEKSTGTFNCELRRTGDLSEAQTFRVTTRDASGNTNRLLTSDVKFTAQSNKTYISLQPVNNTSINPDPRVAVVVNEPLNNGYTCVIDTVLMEDDDLIPLTLELDKSEYNEGDVMHVTASVPQRYYANEALDVYLAIEQSKRFKLPQYIHFESGATTATIDIPVLQDKTPANVQTIKLTGTANRHQKAEVLFVLNDDDTPAIEMTLTPTTVSEGAGPSAIFGTITRTGVTNNQITIKLADDGNNDIYYSTRQVTMPAGTTKVNFPLGVRDNAIVEGDRTVNVTATIYISDCNCEAIGDKQTSVSIPVTITDDDGPALSIMLSKATIMEGDPNGTTFTVSRNTTDKSQPVEVHIAVGTYGVEFPSTVTIPAGASSATGVLRALANDEEEGDRTLSIVASASGYSGTSTWLLISDRTLPDLALEVNDLSGKVIQSGGGITIEAKVMNIGAATMQGGTMVKVYQDGSVVSEYSIADDIAMGDTVTCYIGLQCPTVPGTYNYAVKVNSDKNKAELQYINNESKQMAVTVKTNFTYEMTTDKAVYLEGDTVILSGRIMGINESINISGQKLDAYTIFNGSRQSLEVTTTESGTFMVKYAIPKGYKGKHSFGACVSGEKLTTELGYFIVCGFESVGNPYFKHEIFKGDPYEGTITLRNLTEQPLHNVTPTLSGATANYDIEISSLAELPANGTGVITYRITAKEATAGNQWEVIDVTINTDEGAKLVVPFYNYARLHKPNLVVSTNSITTTVTKGQSRTYPIILTNTGLAETGKISVALPASMSQFISLATPAEMQSLHTGDSTTVMLRFTAGDGLDVNLIQKGSIAINCEEGNGVAVYFNVKVVSESKGALRVQVRDENTIYGNKDGQKPYVKGATVQLKDYNTGAVVAQGTTPDDTDAGILFEDINEGYYQLYVTANKHDSYRQNVMVNPGDTTVHLATISYQAVTITWDVVETEVEDEYEIVTTVEYETQVPVPVMRMTAPDSLFLNDIEYGKATMFNVVLRNDGLIAAQEVKITLPSAPGFTFTPLVQHTNFTLGAGQSYIIPVRVTRDEPAAGVKGMRHAAGNIPCKGRLDEEYKWPCGEDSKLGFLQKPIDFLKKIECTDPKPVNWQAGTYDPTTMPGSPGGPGGGGGGIGPGGELVVAGLVRLACVLCECFCKVPPIPTPPCKDLAGDISKGSVPASNTLSCAGDLGSKKAAKAAPVVGCIEAMANGVKAFGLGPKAPTQPSLLQAASLKYLLYYDYLEIYHDFAKEKTGAPNLIDSIPPKFFEYLYGVDLRLEELHDKNELYNLNPNTVPLMLAVGEADYTGITIHMPNQVGIYYDFNIRRYVERMQNTYRILDGLEPTNDNHVSFEKLREFQTRLDDCKQGLVDMGFISWEELIESANGNVLEHLENQSSNTCATVKLEIEQKLVLTRQAFRGTLTIDNSTENTLKDIELDVIVQNLLGEQATSHEFQINFESITGFTGSVDGPWTLAPKGKGVATILFIPTKYAAPDTITTYSFGGDLSWHDGSTYQTRALYPVKLQVKPSPELDLTYFMQRDVYGDNPLTEEVEPVIPSEFSVLIHNKGKGKATNVRMMTKQPKIVENAKGLLVDFAIVSSSLNGGEKAMALDSLIATQFGDIPSGSSSYATWDLTSSLLGHFTSYDVSVTHVTSYGNPDLSLLDEVTIHELIHSVNARFGDQKYRAWVCNDVEDGHAEPDHIYFSNGEDEDMKTLSAITTVTALGDSKWRVRVTVPQKEWFYTAVADPTGGSAKILSIKDETTGEEMDPENFWTTQWTMQDGWDPLPENKLHIVDYADGPKTFSYVVEFEPTPEIRLDVLSIATVPADDDIAEEVIDQLTVTFNKGIDATTFTRDDLVLRYEGVKQNIDLPITMVENDSIFRLNTSSLSANGYYWLQVKTDSIRDKEGFLGYKGKQVKWMLFKDGLVHYNVMPWPAEGGTIESSSGNAEGNALYGHLLTLTGAPTEGYDFSYWGLLADEVTTNSAHGNAAGIKGKFLAPKIGTDFDESKLERFSTDPTITVEMNKMYNLVAVFKPKTYNVNIVVPTAVGEVNVGSGIYDYGTVLNLKATANDGYRIIGFIVNDDTDHEVDGDEYEHTVTGDATIVVDYKDYAPVSVILQDTKDYVPEAVELANVKLQRSFRKGSWNSICLPCAVEKPEDVFGTGTKVARLDGLLNGQFLVFEVVSRMEANVPYLIKPGTITNNSLLANGQTKTSFYDIMGTSIEEPGADGPIDKTSDGIDFVGSYQNVMVPTADGNYYISSDVVYYVDEAAMVPTGRFRGYFHTEIEGLAKRMGVQIGDEIETAIIDLPGQTPMGNIYSIDGKLVYKAGDTKNLRKLPTGIYIMNGCKVVVK